MNEKIDLTKILKDCPKGTKLYSIAYGDVSFEKITDSELYPIIIRIDDSYTATFPADGQIYANSNGECALFPSKEQRDWTKFMAPWYKKDRLDPRTFKPFDKVLVRDRGEYKWMCDFFSHIEAEGERFNYWCVGSNLEYCIPYNENTKHLVGTTEDAPEFYRYWED